MWKSLGDHDVQLSRALLFWTGINWKHSNHNHKYKAYWVPRNTRYHTYIAMGYPHSLAYKCHELPLWSLHTISMGCPYGLPLSCLDYPKFLCTSSIGYPYGLSYKCKGLPPRSFMKVSHMLLEHTQYSDKTHLSHRIS